jgi:uncharacterized protein (TIGR03067 family)
VDDLQDFQGTWQAVWLADDGRKMTAEEVGEVRLMISGDHYMLRRGGSESHGIIGRTARARNHGTVDFVAEGPGGAGEPCRGIYVLEGDDLTVCVAPPGRERPASFAARRGSGHSLYLLRRHLPSRVRPVEEAAN